MCNVYMILYPADIRDWIDEMENEISKTNMKWRKRKSPIRTPALPQAPRKISYKIL
jgi:hypothetical protein